MNKSQLLEILSYPRFSSSKGEEFILEKFFTPISSNYDQFGNWWYSNSNTSTTLFTAHSDTVHKKTANNKYDLVEKSGMLSVKGGGVLGADDGTGLFILLELINHGVPGTYVVYRGEEVGGLGSSNSAYYEQDIYNQFDRVISFDRAGYTDVITHQAGMVCCSNEFASELCNQLGMGFTPSPDGIFTDSANLTHLVPECTNISVGYFNQHTTKEVQDVVWLERFIKSLKQVNWEELPTVRTVESNFKNWTSYKPLLTSLVRENPEAVAVILEQLGFDEYELSMEIREISGDLL